MPFDSTPAELKAPVKHEKLLWLADVLEDRTRWPEGFRWNYDECGSCAMGLAAALGAAIAPNKSAMIDAGFIPNFASGELIFFGEHPSFNLTRAPADSPLRFVPANALAAITPEMVATAIRQYVAENP